MQVVMLRARACSEVGSAWWLVLLVKPMGTTIAGAPVGGGICGESLPARARVASGWLCSLEGFTAMWRSFMTLPSQVIMKRV